MIFLLNNLSDVIIKVIFINIYRQIVLCPECLLEFVDFLSNIVVPVKKCVIMFVLNRQKSSLNMTQNSLTMFLPNTKYQLN